MPYNSTYYNFLIFQKSKILNKKNKLKTLRINKQKE